MFVIQRRQSALSPWITISSATKQNAQIIVISNNNDQGWIKYRLIQKEGN